MLKFSNPFLKVVASSCVGVVKHRFVRRDAVQFLSPRMRSLFVSTIQEDLRWIDDAIKQREFPLVGKRFYSVAGALGMVRAADLARECAELARLLLEEAVDDSIILIVQRMLCNISNVLNAVQLEVSSNAERLDENT